MLDAYTLISAQNLAFKPKDAESKIIGVKIYAMPEQINEPVTTIFIRNWHIDYAKIKQGQQIFLDYKAKGRNKVEFTAAFSDKEGKNAILIPPKT